MRVYHGSSVVVMNPDVRFSRKRLDFGMGFYVTDIEEQAVTFARRKGISNRSSGFVSVYDYNEKAANLFRKRVFRGVSESWFDVVVMCRTGNLLISRDYDIIIGEIADDDVIATINAYIMNPMLVDKNAAMLALKYKKRNNQICLNSNKVINSVLKYVGFYEVRW
jgi:hypothetical protein